MRVGRILAVMLLLAAIGGGTWWVLRTRGGGNAMLTGPAVTLSWKGKFEGAVTLPATVNWCPGSRVAIVEGLSNDTGFVLVVHAADSLAKGTLSILPHEFVANGPRPAASAAMRWPADSATLAGYRGQNGLLELVPGDRLLSGTFTARMQPPMSLDTISVTGSFRNLAVESRAAGCP